jgi:hypothetical protein
MTTFDIIKKHIDAWDPMELLATGAPKDEYDVESRMIEERFFSGITTKELARILAKVFSAQFSESFSIADCLNTAEQIYNEHNV